MKRILLLGVGSALMFTMGGVGPAQADNGYHISSAPTVAGQYTVDVNLGAGQCASCHRAHTAKAVRLLKDAQPALCYSCHTAGTGAKTDVKNGRNTQSNGALRGGGFAFAKMNAAAPIKIMTLKLGTDGNPEVVNGVPTGALSTASKSVGVLGTGIQTTSQHNVGTTAGDNEGLTMWGNGAVSATANTGQAGITLECGSCHDPHGNGNYRILKPVPNGADTLGAVVGVNIPDATGDPRTAAGYANRVYDTLDYWNVADRKVPSTKGGIAPADVTPIADTTSTDGYIANVSQWCSTCHTRYLATKPATNPKGPDGKTLGPDSVPLADGTGAIDAVFTYRHRSDSTDKAGVSRPNCIQCHVSHGTNASMADSVDVPLPGGASAPSGDSRLLRVNNRATCLMCHSK